MGSHLLLAIPRLIRALFWIMIPWGNFWANKWPILMGLGLIMTQICAYKVSFSSLCRLSLCRDFCMKQRLFPRVRPNDPFTFNTSVATSTTTLPKKLSRFFHQKEDHLHKIWKLWSTASNHRWLPNRSVFWKKCNCKCLKTVFYYLERTAIHG